MSDRPRFRHGPGAASGSAYLRVGLLGSAEFCREKLDGVGPVVRLKTTISQAIASPTGVIDTPVLAVPVAIYIFTST